MTTPARSGGGALRQRAVVVWLVLLVLGAVVAARTRYVADLSAFLPSSPSAEQAVLLEQVQNGIASRLVLIGIEGGDASGRAEASKALGATLRASGLFDAVHNGDNSGFELTGRFLFEHRYLLSPSVDAARFTADGLREGIGETTALLGTPAGSMIKPIILRDPTGETVRMAESLVPSQSPRSDGGVWVSRRAPRAVLLATTRATGGDLDAQERALDRVRTGFAPFAARGLTLQVSGSGSFAVESRARIKGEVERLALAGGAAIVALLLLAFGGSLGTLFVALLPVVSGVVAGIAAVGLVFGQVHGITLGFGTTLIGEAVDYAIYYLIQARPAGTGRSRRTGDGSGSGRGDGWPAKADDGPGGGGSGGPSMGAGEGPRAGAGEGPRAGAGEGPRAGAGEGPRAGAGARHWLAASWPTVRLGLWTSVCGFAALLFSGFPGLRQLGVFSVAGLAAAALTTRWVLTRTSPDGAPGTGLRRRLGRTVGWLTARLPRLAWPLGLVTMAAAVVLAVSPSAWRGDLASLSPVGAERMRLDADLRADLGAADTGVLVAVAGRDEAGALAAAEAAGARLDPLVDRGLLAGYESPARMLPSPATQTARQRALPDPATLAARLAEATADGPLPAARLGGFLADVEAARNLPLVTRESLRATPLHAALDALLVPGTDGRPWRALLSVQGGGRPIDPEALRAALAGLPEAQVVDIGVELKGLYARYLHEAGWQALLGAAAVCLLLGLHLRSARRFGRIALPVVASVVIVLGALTAAGVALGILHLVGLLLTVAIGSNYALFFDQLRELPTGGPEAVDHDTLASLALANLTAVISFGLLAASDIPVLYAVGEVVAPGILLCLVLSGAFIAPRGGRHRRSP